MNIHQAISFCEHFPPMSLVLSVQTSKLEACVLPVFLSPRNVLPLLFPGAWRLLAREHFRLFFFFSIPTGRGCGGVHQGHACSLTACKQTAGRPAVNFSKSLFFGWNSSNSWSHLFRVESIRRHGCFNLSSFWTVSVRLFLGTCRQITYRRHPSAV